MAIRKSHLLTVKVFRSGRLETNTYIVADEEAGEALVVDPAESAAQSLPYLRSGGYRVAAIVNTHGHYDHVSGNRAMKEATGAPVMIHPADAALAEQASGLARFVSDRAEDSPPADALLEEGSELICGKFLFRVLHTPGHTPGGITLDGEGRLFCGDLLSEEGVGRTRLPGCNEELLRQSIRRQILNRPDGTMIYPGHGSAIRMGKDRVFLTTPENP